MFPGEEPEITNPKLCCAIAANVQTGLVAVACKATTTETSSICHICRGCRRTPSDGSSNSARFDPLHSARKPRDRSRSAAGRKTWNSDGVRWQRRQMWHAKPLANKVLPILLSTCMRIRQHWNMSYRWQLPFATSVSISSERPEAQCEPPKKQNRDYCHGPAPERTLPP